jgi:CheY-like chemotaxis protein
MTQIIFAGSNLATLPAFKGFIEESGGRITILGSGKQVLEAVAEWEFDLLIADEYLGDMSGIELIKEVITCRPWLNCAVLSSRSPENFHEASEGLGILMQLPVMPGRKEAGALMDHLKKIKSFTVGT